MTDRLETCPTDVAHASMERVWEHLTNPSRFYWIDASLIEAPDRSLRARDRVVFAASLGLRVAWTVLALDPPRHIALEIALPFGIVNQETVVLTPLDAESCRITFN